MDANSLKKAETTPTGYENLSFSHDDQVTILQHILLVFSLE